MNIKKILLVGITALLMSGCGNTADKDNTVTYTLEEIAKAPQNLKDMAVADEALYFYTAQGIEQWNEGTSTVVYALQGDMPGYLDVAEGKCVFDLADQLIVYHLDEKNIVQIGLEGRDNISKILLKEDKIWILYDTSYTGENKLLAYYDLQNQTWTDYDLKDFNVLGWDIDKEGNFVILHKLFNENNEENLSISILEAASKEVLESYPFDEKIQGLYQVESCDIKARENTLYIGLNDSVYAFDMKAESLKLLYSEEGKLFSKVVLYQEQILVNSKELDKNQIYILQVGTVNEKEQLAILMPNEVKALASSNDAFIKEVELLKTEYPDLSCQIVGLCDYENYEDKIRTKLLAKDEDFDLFYMHTTSLVKMKGKLLEPLEDEGFNTIAKELYEGAKRTITMDGKQIGIVESYSVPGFIMNEALQDVVDVNYEESLTWDWKTFMYLTDTWSEDTDYDGQVDRWFSDLTANDILRFMIYTYDIQNETTSLEENIYEDAVFMELVEEVKVLNEKGKLMSHDMRDSGKVTCFLNKVDNLSLMTQTVSEVGPKAVTYYALPVIDSNIPIFYTGGGIYCINPYSPKKEMAKKVLLEAIKPEVSIPQTKSMIYKNREWYTTYYDAYLEAEKQKGNLVQDDREIGRRLTMTDAMQSVFDYVYSHADISQISGYVPQNFEDLLTQYLEEDVSLEVLIANLGEMRKSMK